jgi:hypothetical protein
MHDALFLKRLRGEKMIRNPEQFLGSKMRVLEGVRGVW